MQEQRPKQLAARSKLCFLLLLCGGILTARALAAQAYETVHSFTSDRGGPSGGLIQEPDGKLYGVAGNGGRYGRGTVFVLTPDGLGGFGYAELHEFNGGDGDAPRAPLVKGNDGLFYGATYWGGAHNLGAVFRVDALGNFELLHSFSGADGETPAGPLCQANDGHLYGTTMFGGAGGFGTAYRLTASGVATIHAFTPFEDRPSGGLVQAGDGLLYGAAWTDAGTGGILYRMTLAGAVTLVHTFSGTDGAQPIWELVEATDGKLYGVANGGVNAGVVYRIDTSGTFELLHALTAAEGAFPGRLVEASDGNLYGGTRYGGSENRGTIFRISTLGAFELLHACASSEPGHIGGKLLELEPGTFVGGGSSPISPYGGLFVFELPSSLTLLRDFATPEGAWPAAEVRQATDGVLYGSTTDGGPGGFGTLFRLDLAGAFETLHAFSDSDGRDPASSLFQANDGLLYGTSAYSTSTFGTIFRLGLDGAFTLLGDFSQIQMSSPKDLIQASDGYLYGVAEYGGIVRLDLTGDVELLVASPSNEAFNSELAQTADGWIYGTGRDTSTDRSYIFRFDASGAFEEVYGFTGGADGRRPYSGLLLGSDGNLYGTTTTGGADDSGTVFRYEPAPGALTTLCSFGSPVSGDASEPGGLHEGPGGSLYGTSRLGGLHDRGTVFRVAPTGEESVVHSFGSGGDDGMDPDARVRPASDGRLYGTTTAGGEFGGGAVYRINPGAALSVTALVPSSGPANAGTPVMLSGAGFQPGASVSLGKVAATGVSVLGDNEISATTPVLEAGNLYYAFVVNPDGGSGSLARAWLADFHDVPVDDLFHDSVESLVRNGITVGCGYGYYCGSQRVTRAQMAVFLLRSKLGAGYIPPPATGTVFTDVPASAFAADYIEDLAARGVTVGCGGGLYCPENAVTRAQMAAFLLRALLGPGYMPPDAVGVFEDVPVDAFAANYIEDLYGRGITAGCSASPLLYCPASYSTRSQMAVFLVATFELP